MRVFELARELNIPGKDLIKRIVAMGIPVENNFNVLEEATIAQIKARMLEPVTRVETDSAPKPEETAEAPRKRRIISARRSGEVHKIQESLGVSGPLPEDRLTRAEVKPEPAPLAALPVDEALPEPSLKPRIVRTARLAEEAPGAPAAAGPEPEGPAAAQGAEAPLAAAPGEGAAAPAAPSVPLGPGVPAPRSAVTPRPPLMGLKILKRGTPAEAAASAAKAAEAPAGQWREVKKGEKRGAAVADETEAEARRGAGWRKGAGDRTGRVAILPGADERGRVPKRRSPEKRARLAARAQEHEADAKHTFGPRRRAIKIGPAITVSELASAIGVKAPDIIKKLIGLGLMATINAPIDGPTAELVASDFNVEIQVDMSSLEDLTKEEAVDAAKLQPRPPIVTIMGHVDHGKTTLLDTIRKSHLTDREAGGITQHIGAYYVSDEAGDIVFLDTPGHEAFTSLRSRGANVTDLVVLIVAADDGVMPQTVEAIDHARAAKVPIMVAINKIDRPGADQEKIKRQLMEHQLVSEELGGETIFVPISAKTGQGVPQLLEMIHLQAEVLDLKAVRDGAARGYVIESRMDRQRGPGATVIVQRGTLRVGDHFVAGSTFGRIRALFDDLGRPLDEALPSRPVEILGFDALPEAGDRFVVMADEKLARQVATLRAERKKEPVGGPSRHTKLEDFLARAASQDQIRTLNLILKADTQGSLEALRGSLEKEGNQQVRVELVRAGVGGITETDVSLAASTDAVVIGFNVRSEAKATELARSEGVDVKTYTIIYELINDMHAALQGMLKPIVREEIIGHCEVRQVFNMSREGTIAGGYVADGRLERNSQVRLYRNNVVVHTGQIQGLRRFKDDVSNVQQGYECGVRLLNFNDLKEGDLIEAFIKVEETAKLERAGRAS
jgi:translation initiation factor IF-2